METNHPTETGQVAARELTAEEVGVVSGAATDLRMPFGIVFQFNDRGCWALWGPDKSNGPVKEGGC